MPSKHKTNQTLRLINAVYKGVWEAFKSKSPKLLEKPKQTILMVRKKIFLSHSNEASERGDSIIS